MRGADLFVFKDAVGSGKKCDQIIDFNSFEGDRVVLHRRSFKAMSRNPSFAIASNNRELNSLGQTSADILYNQSSGKLFYNFNGEEKGMGSQGLFAKLIGSPELSASDLGWI